MRCEPITNPNAPNAKYNYRTQSHKIHSNGQSFIVLIRLGSED
jgi:hypothetical protein